MGGWHSPCSANIFRCTLSTLFLLVPELSARSNGCVPMYLSESPDNLWRLVIKTLAATAAEDQALLANWLPLQEVRVMRRRVSESVQSSVSACAYASVGWLV